MNIMKYILKSFALVFRYLNIYAGIGKHKCHKQRHTFANAISASIMNCCIIHNLINNVIQKCYLYLIREMLIHVCSFRYVEALNLKLKLECLYLYSEIIVRKFGFAIEHQNFVVINPNVKYKLLIVSTCKTILNNSFN